MNLSRRFGIRGAAILALLLFVFPLAVAAADLPAPSTDFYVADYAGVLSEETESEIVVENDALYRETGAQIVIVTMETLDGADIADFTYDLFAEWGIGSAEKNNGFLLVLAIEEDDYYALQGVGLSERLSDSTISDMLNEYLEPDFAAKNYDAGVQTLFQAVLSRVKAIEADRVDSGVKENFSRIADAAASRRESASGFVATIGNFFKKGILLIFLVVVLLLVIILSIFRRPRWRYMGGAGWGGRFYGGRFGRRRRPPPPPPMGGFGFGPPPPVGPAGLAAGGLPVAPVSAVLPLQAGGAAVGPQVAALAAEDDGRAVSTCLLSKKAAAPIKRRRCCVFEEPGLPTTMCRLFAGGISVMRRNGPCLEGLTKGPD